MKSLKYIILLSFITLSSCEEGFFDVNEDPNNPLTSSPELTFPAAQSALAFVYGGYYNIAGEFWAQHWTQSNGAGQYRVFDNWDVTTSTLSGQYASLYNEALNDLAYVSGEAKANGLGTFYFASEVLKVYIYQLLVDLYDQQPYSQALKGDIGLLNPEYVSGEAIYDSLVIALDRAYEFYQDDVAKESMSSDLYFDGDMQAWIQFYNSLKLKIFLRQSFVPERQSIVTQGISELFSSNPVFLTDRSVTMTQFGTAVNSQNPTYETEVRFMGNNNLVASENIVGFLADTENLGAEIDPRLYEYFNASKASSDYRGQKQGDNTNPSYTNDDNFSKPKLGAQDPVILMSAAEVNFLLAEVALRYPSESGLSITDAQEYYEQGIEASFTSLGLDVAEAANLYSGGGRYEFPIDFEDQLEAIITQKWVSFVNTQGMEAYIEFKRTGYPKAQWDYSSDYILTTPVNNVTGGRPIKRLQFSDDEISRNPNVPAVIEPTVPVWWDVRDAVSN